MASLSVRAEVGNGGSVAIAGFTIVEEPERVLVRGIGPELERFEVTGFLVDPILTIVDADGTPIQTNDDWDPSDQTIFDQVGAFSLAPGSKDAAIVITLSPGLYTAIVSGVGGTTGVALAEVYDVTNDTGSRLISLSARTHVGTGDNILIPGVYVSPGGGTRRLLIRAAGPSLVKLGVAETLENPQLTVAPFGQSSIGYNDDWGSDETHILNAAFKSAGAFLYSNEQSFDAAIVRDVSPGLYTVQISDLTGQTGVALAEVCDVTPTGPPATVTIAVTDPEADESGANMAEFTLTRTGNTSDLLIVNFVPSGSAGNVSDYAFLNGRAAFASGEDTITIVLDPVPDLETESTEDATLTLASGLGYNVGAQSAATASIGNSDGVLYETTLRPETSAQGSSASGTATILINSAGTLATVRVLVNNLSSDVTSAYLRYGEPNEIGEYLQRIPVDGSATTWRLRPGANYTVADLVEGLQSGLIYLGIETADYPTGEVRGHFIRSVGTSEFTPPPDPSPAPTAAADSIEAARFLTQATFGPTLASISALEQITFADWIDEQMALPMSLHRDAIMSDYATYPDEGIDGQDLPSTSNRTAAWWGVVLRGNDQLRQRVAFALSEIFVISENDDDVWFWQEGTSNYYDILVRNAFGNYRDLIEEVALSPMMGTYLSHLRNARAESEDGPQPDENFAREIMQLFSIGLVQLQPDGTRLLDEDGLPIPTYDQQTITETAKVLTGWAFHSNSLEDWRFRFGDQDWINPMTLFPNFHDDGPKNIVRGVRLPGGQGGEADLNDLLDTLFNHPNTGPFVARRLIQRLVTSNPTPAYVYRVAQAFEDNGSGVRGDLGAVIRAILLDYEARSPDAANAEEFGKLKEPLLRVSATLRGLTGVSGTQRIPLPWLGWHINQSPLRSPTVFNFFEPDYVKSGDLAAAGLFAPEFQILTDTQAIKQPNVIPLIAWDVFENVAFNYGELNALVATPDQLVDRISLVLAPGQLSASSRDEIIQALNDLPSWTSDNWHVVTAIMLVYSCPEGAIQN